MYTAYDFETDKYVASTSPYLLKVKAPDFKSYDFNQPVTITKVSFFRTTYIRFGVEYYFWIEQGIPLEDYDDEIHCYFANLDVENNGYIPIGELKNVVKNKEI